MRPLKLFAATLFVCFCAASLQADPVVVPVTITSGGGSFNRSGAGFFQFSNADGSVLLNVETFFTAAMNPVNRCRPCLPGSTINLGFEAIDGDVRGTAVFNGTNYLLTGFPQGFAGSVTLPTTVGDASFLLPFTLGGRLDLFLPGTSRERDVLFTLQLSGMGNVFAQFGAAAGRPDLYNITQNIYTVTAPIPEPATMTLLITGLAGVGVAVRKRRKAHNTEA
jgi:hypothetical protein